MATTTRRRRTPPARLLGSGLIPRTYEDRAAGVRKEYTDELANLSGAESTLFRDYGFKGTIDPTTGAASYEVDTANKFGQYQQWLRGLAENLSGARADAVSRGLGGRGLSMARANLARFAGNQQQAEMLNNFTGAATGIFQKRGAALGLQNRGLNDLEGEALNWWEENAPDDEGVGDPTDGSPNQQWVRKAIRGKYYPRSGRVRGGRGGPIYD